jgi:hypothetical protein
MISDREKFYELWDRIKREGKENVLEYLEKSDYFLAPASTQYHSSYEGGLLAHSLNVTYKLYELSEKNDLKWEKEDSIIIIGLLHDICKTHFYSVEYKNVKDKDNNWIKVPYYKVDDKMPLGVHGDKSVMLLQRLGLEMSNEEMYCIRYHMGAYEGESVYSSLGRAKKKYSNILWVHLSDELASIEEEKNG